MFRKAVWVMLGVNLVLAGVLLIQHDLIARVLPGESEAQAQARGRQAEPVMITGEVQGITNDVVYIVDIANERLTAMTYDTQNKKLRFMKNSIDLRKVFSRKR